MELEILRFPPHANFSMTETAVASTGAAVRFRAIESLDQLRSARRPVLPLPIQGTWNFFIGAEGPGPGYRLINESLAVLPADARERILLCLDCGGEGMTLNPQMHDELGALLVKWDLPCKRVFLLTSCFDGKNRYESWCSAQGRRPIFEPIYSPVQLYFVSGRFAPLLSAEVISAMVERRSPFLNADPRPRKFLSLNYSPWSWRWLTLLHLLDQELLHEGEVSFHGRPAGVGPGEPVCALGDIEAELIALRTPERLLHRLPELDASTPIIIDDDAPASRNAKAYDARIDKFYDRTYFSLVTESDATGTGGGRFSEKVLKPLFNLHPFTLVGGGGVLGELRRLGFLTFSPLIDESYDTIEDPVERFRASLAVSDRLARLDHESWEPLLVELWPRLAHNLLHFISAPRRLALKDEALLALAING